VGKGGIAGTASVANTARTGGDAVGGGDAGSVGGAGMSGSGKAVFSMAAKPGRTRVRGVNCYHPLSL
jgi:hypothetical protein